MDRVRGYSPKVQSSRKLRAAVIAELKKHNFKNILDFGSGFGGMCGEIAKNFPDAKVTGIEIMPTPFIISKLFQRSRNVKILMKDAFDFVKKSDGFDVGVFYQMPSIMKRAKEEIAHKFKIMIVLDFPLPNKKPTKAIKLHDDFMGQHRLYVYKILGFK
jgi:precorrin-6B methylase 2